MSESAIIIRPESHIHSILQCGQLTLDRIQFDIEQFNDDLFEIFYIMCPPQIKRAVKKISAEYFYGRLAARYATERFGFTDNLPINADRSPKWPEGLHGSISHCEGEAIAVALPKTDCAGVDVDVEKIATGDALTALKSMVVNKEELQRLQQYQHVFAEAILLTLVFSAKESFYKAAYPQVQRFFGFEALRFQSLNADKQHVTFTVMKDLRVQFPQGLQIVIDFCLPEQDIATAALKIQSFIYY